MLNIIILSFRKVFYILEKWMEKCTTCWFNTLIYCKMITYLLLDIQVPAQLQALCSILYYSANAGDSSWKNSTYFFPSNWQFSTNSLDPGLVIICSNKFLLNNITLSCPLSTEETSFTDFLSFVPVFLLKTSKIGCVYFFILLHMFLLYIVLYLACCINKPGTLNIIQLFRIHMKYKRVLISLLWLQSILLCWYVIFSISCPDTWTLEDFLISSIENKETPCAYIILYKNMTGLIKLGMIYFLLFY